MTHLKQIGLDYMDWAERHNGAFPFNVSTNADGSKELCSPGRDGIETDAAAQFRSFATGLVGYDYGTFTTKIFVCPADTNRQPAVDFRELRIANISYQLYCCTNKLGDRPPSMLLHCPIHGWTLYTDGSIVNTGTNK